MNTITSTLGSISLGASSTFRNLSVIPLLAETTFQRDYLGLAEAVRTGTARVGEVSSGGSVPELMIENSGAKPVLILEGEELVGAKQNRTANVTILVPAGKSLRIPVTCVESGRWAYQGENLEPSRQVHFARGRLNKMLSVSESMRQAGSRHADQGRVWHDIAQKSARMHVSAPTSAMSEVFESNRDRLDDYVGAFTPLPSQVGAVFAIGDRIEGLELFDCRETLAEMLPKLVRSYAIDAIERNASQQGPPAEDAALRFVEAVKGSEFDTYPAVGAGTEIRLQTRDLVAAGLVADERLVHLVAFAAGADERRGDPESHWIDRLRTRRNRMRR